jgi:hypothetical protein
MTKSSLAKMLLVPVVVLSALLTGCGSTDSPGSTKGGTTTAADPEFDKRVKFAQCMRRNGVDMPDPAAPGSGPEGGGLQISDSAAFQAALPKCRELMPNAGGAAQVAPEEIERRTKFAACMRKNGVADFPDPDPNAPAAEAYVPDANDAAAVKTVTKATEVCNAEVGELGAR